MCSQDILIGKYGFADHFVRPSAHRFFMRPPLFRILLGIEYLIAVQALIAFWSHAGGQYHLELMFWPWKIAIPLAGAALVVAMTSGLARGLRWRSARILLMGVSLLLLMVVAGFVTYYYHVNEPTDQDDDDPPAQITRTHFETAHNGGSRVVTPTPKYLC
jgi:hypothetical protein